MTAPPTPSILAARPRDVADVLAVADALRPRPLDADERRDVLRHASAVLRDLGDGPEALAAFIAEYGTAPRYRGVFERARNLYRSSPRRIPAAAPVTPSGEPQHEHRDLVPDPTHHRRTRRGSGGGVPGPRH